MGIEGVWKVRYSPVGVAEAEKFDEKQAALIVLEGGSVSRLDPYGKVSVNVISDDEVRVTRKA